MCRIDIRIRNRAVAGSSNTIRDQRGLHVLIECMLQCLVTYYSSQEMMRLTIAPTPKPTALAPGMQIHATTCTTIAKRHLLPPWWYKKKRTAYKQSPNIRHTSYKLPPVSRPLIETCVYLGWFAAPPTTRRHQHQSLHLLEMEQEMIRKPRETQ
jgi:hypothetical protein